MSYNQPPTAYQPPPKKRHTARNVLIVFAVLSVLGIGGCLAVVGLVGSELEKESNTEHSVVYKVTGTSKVASTLTYTTDGGTTTEQVSNAKLPWSKSLKIKGMISIYQISAQNGLGETGTITCTIEVDGEVVKTATAEGEAAIASCDHSS